MKSGCNWRAYAIFVPMVHNSRKFRMDISQEAHAGLLLKNPSYAQTVRGRTHKTSSQHSTSTSTSRQTGVELPDSISICAYSRQLIGTKLHTGIFIKGSDEIRPSFTVHVRRPPSVWANSQRQPHSEKWNFRNNKSRSLTNTPPRAHPRRPPPRRVLM